MATEITPDEIEEQPSTEEAVAEEPAPEPEAPTEAEPAQEEPVTEAPKQTYFFPPVDRDEPGRSVEASSLEEAQKLVENA